MQANSTMSLGKTAAACRPLLSSRFSRPDLIHGTLLRLLVRTPAEKLCPVAKAPAREVVVLELADQFWFEWKPFCVTLIARPAAGTAGSLAGKSFAPHQWFEDGLQL